MATTLSFLAFAQKEKVAITSSETTITITVARGLNAVQMVAGSDWTFDYTASQATGDQIPVKANQPFTLLFKESLTMTIYASTAATATVRFYPVL